MASCPPVASRRPQALDIDIFALAQKPVN